MRPFFFGFFCEYKMENLNSEMKMDDLTIMAPKFDYRDISSKLIANGKVYMIDAPIRFPIHPGTNNDNIIAQLVDQFEVIVCNDELSDDGLYIKTILPIDGWIRKECIDNGLLRELNENSLSSLLDKQDFIMNKKEYNQYIKPNGFVKCLNCILPNCCINKIRKFPKWIFAGFVFLNILGELIVFIDTISDLNVWWQFGKADENTFFTLTFLFIFAPYYITWASAFGFLQKKVMFL